MTHSGGILIICFYKNHNSIIRICLCSGISRKVFKPNSSVFWQAKNYQHKGQKDSPELPETLEIMEMTENFTKVTKYLSKFKETLINCLGKISRQKAVRINFLWIPRFWICSMAKNENPEMPEINRKLSNSKKHQLLTFYCY